MKIVLEESDIVEIVTSHVKKENLLGLSNKPFNVTLEISGTEVTANLETEAASLTGAPKKKTARRSPSKAKAAEPEKDEQQVPASKKAVMDSPGKVADEPKVEEAPAAAAEKAEDDKPPFKEESPAVEEPADEPEPQEAKPTNSKSLFA